MASVWLFIVPLVFTACSSEESSGRDTNPVNDPLSSFPSNQLPSSGNISGCASGSCVLFRECPMAMEMFGNSRGTGMLGPNICNADGAAGVCCQNLTLNAATRSGVVEEDATSRIPTLCGLSLAARITRGRNVSLGEYPWMAVLLQQSPRSGTFFHCGGSLINSRYVLTAAHCVDEVRLPRGYSLSVSLGDHVLNTDPDCASSTCAPNAIRIAVESIIVHPEYKGLINDIALLRLSRPVTLSEYIIPICLRGLRETEALTTGKLTVAGWGSDGTRSTTNILNAASLPIVSPSVCRSLYSSAFNVDGRQLCLGSEQGMDSCTGDSGGPAFTFDSSGRAVQLGLVSFGPTVACGQVAAVYTHVPYYLDSFITPNIKI